MPRARHGITYRGAGLSGQVPAPVAQRRDYEYRPEPDQPSPREIVAGLHAQIAAFSPEHASLVAEFERRQAARERQS